LRKEFAGAKTVSPAKYNIGIFDSFNQGLLLCWQQVLFKL
jgi:hypothetical protein